jgi:hypothetical protein
MGKARDLAMVEFPTSTGNCFRHVEDCPMTNTDNAANHDFMANARRNLKTNNGQQRHSTPSTDVSKPNSLSLARLFKGVGFFFAVLFTAIALVFVNGWLATGVVCISILVCFSRKLKNHGISITVGVFLLLIALPLILAGWSSEQQKSALAPLRLSSPLAYLEKARGVLSHDKWLEEAKLLAPELYKTEQAKDRCRHKSRSTEKARRATICTTLYQSVGWFS